MIRVNRLGLAVLPLIAICAAQASAHKHVHHIPRHVSSTGIGVAIDQARLVSFSRPAKTVFVGNPWIADVSMLDSRHYFVLGKTLGLTNVIALDENGAQIDNKPVMVTNNFAAATLNRGPEQYNFTCTSVHCETTPKQGDPKPWFDAAEQAAGEHEDAGTKSATPSSGAQSPSPND